MEDLEDGGLAVLVDFITFRYVDAKLNANVSAGVRSRLSQNHSVLSGDSCHACIRTRAAGLMRMGTHTCQRGKEVGIIECIRQYHLAHVYVTGYTDL